MRLLKRLLRRAAVVGLGILTVWLIAFVFGFTDSRLPTVLALAVTYGAAAYFILPRIVRMSLKILQRKRVPRFDKQLYDRARDPPPFLDWLIGVRVRSHGDGCALITGP